MEKIGQEEGRDTKGGKGRRGRRDELQGVHKSNAG
jgi:hypothetical protein